MGQNRRKQKKLIMSLKFLRKFIKEEIGRNFHTINTNPYTFKDFSDYNIEVTPSSSDQKYYLVVSYQGEKLSHARGYHTHEEAMHAARMIVDNDRIARMNSIEEKEKQ